MPSSVLETIYIEKSKMVKPEQEKIKTKMNKELEEYRIQVKMFVF